ncbi:MAG: hypothetical protein KatS3mg126_1774 [Lysobacteraceae bacterium]|nr:MAG: hypothetical protein KatS3mg126_1774 [Xanthomonadaceae bacterium]
MSRFAGWVLALLLAAAFTVLGAWQHGRGVAKQGYLEAWEAALKAPPKPLLPWTRGREIVAPEPVQGTLQALPEGRWLLLDNARHQGRLGVRAHFIARLGPRLGLLVDAGWLPFDRARGLPPLPPMPAAVQARGLLLPWPGQGIALAETAWPDRGATALLVRLDREALEQDAGLTLIEGILRLGPDADFGFERQLEALPNTLPPEKHFGYALQWWGLALATLATALVLDRRSRKA